MASCALTLFATQKLIRQPTQFFLHSILSYQLLLVVGGRFNRHPMFYMKTNTMESCECFCLHSQSCSFLHRAHLRHNHKDHFQGCVLLKSSWRCATFLLMIIFFQVYQTRQMLCERAGNTLNKNTIVHHIHNHSQHLFQLISSVHLKTLRISHPVHFPLCNSTKVCFLQYSHILKNVLI